MGTNKVNKEPMKSTHTESLGGSLLKMAAIGLAGGIALISLADKVGKTLLHEKDRELDESEEKQLNETESLENTDEVDNEQ